MNRQLPKWIKVGTLLILICVVAGIIIFKPAFSQAIDTFTNNNKALVVSAAIEADPQAPLTDHPEGRLVNAIVADALGQSSNGEPQAAIQSDEPDQESPEMTNEQDQGAFPPEEGEGVFVVDMQAELEGINALSSVYVLPVADFRSDGNDPDGFFYSFMNGNLSGKSDATNNTCLMAPIYLPHGATITDVWATVVDNSPSLHIWLRLFRLDNYSGEVVEVAYMATTAGFSETYLTSISDVTITNPNVSYPTYSYYIGGCIPGTAIKLYSVRIYYN